MTDSRYGAWDYDELDRETGSIVSSAEDDLGLVLDTIVRVESGAPTILVQSLTIKDNGSIVFQGEVRFTDPDDLITWLDEQYAAIFN